MEEHNLRGAEREERQRRRRLTQATLSRTATDHGTHAIRGDDGASGGHPARAPSARAGLRPGRRVRTREDAEDITQEVMLRIVRHRAASTGPADGRLGVPDCGERDRGPLSPGGTPRATGRPGRDVPEPAAWVEPATPAELRRGAGRMYRAAVQRLTPLYREALELTEFEASARSTPRRTSAFRSPGMKARVQRARDAVARAAARVLPRRARPAPRRAGDPARGAAAHATPLAERTIHA